MLSGFVSSRFLVLVLLMVGGVVSISLKFEDIDDLGAEETKVIEERVKNQLRSMKKCFYSDDKNAPDFFGLTGISKTKMPEVMKQISRMHTLTVRIKSDFPATEKMSLELLAGYIIRLAAQQVAHVQFEEAEGYRNFALLCNRYLRYKKAQRMDPNNGGITFVPSGTNEGPHVVPNYKIWKAPQPQ